MLPSGITRSSHTPRQTIINRGVRLWLKLALWNDGKLARKPPWRVRIKLAGKLFTGVLAKPSECHLEGEYLWVSLMLLATMKHQIKTEDSTQDPGREASQKHPPPTNPNTLPTGKWELFTESNLIITKSKDGWLWNCGVIY